MNTPIFPDFFCYAGQTKDTHQKKKTENFSFVLFGVGINLSPVYCPSPVMLHTIFEFNLFVCFFFVGIAVNFVCLSFCRCGCLVGCMLMHSPVFVFVSVCNKLSVAYIHLVQFAISNFHQLICTEISWCHIKQAVVIITSILQLLPANNAGSYLIVEIAGDTLFLVIGSFCFNFYLISLRLMLLFQLLFAAVDCFWRTHTKKKGGWCAGWWLCTCSPSDFIVEISLYQWENSSHSGWNYCLSSVRHSTLLHTVFYLFGLSLFYPHPFSLLLCTFLTHTHTRTSAKATIIHCIQSNIQRKIE